jgi:RecA/RadA recombinase
MCVTSDPATARVALEIADMRHQVGDACQVVIAFTAVFGARLT